MQLYLDDDEVTYAVTQFLRSRKYEVADNPSVEFHFEESDESGTVFSGLTIELLNAS